MCQKRRTGGTVSR